MWTGLRPDISLGVANPAFESQLRDSRPYYLQQPKQAKRYCNVIFHNTRRRLLGIIRTQGTYAIGLAMIRWRRYFCWKSVCARTSFAGRAFALEPECCPATAEAGGKPRNDGGEMIKVETIDRNEKQNKRNSGAFEAPMIDTRSQEK